MRSSATELFFNWLTFHLSCGFAYLSMRNADAADQVMKLLGTRLIDWLTMYITSYNHSAAGEMHDTQKTTQIVEQKEQDYKEFQREGTFACSTYAK